VEWCLKWTKAPAKKPRERKFDERRFSFPALTDRANLCRASGAGGVMVLGFANTLRAGRDVRGHSEGLRRRRAKEVLVRGVFLAGLKPPFLLQLAVGCRCETGSSASARSFDGDGGSSTTAAAPLAVIQRSVFLRRRISFLPGPQHRKRVCVLTCRQTTVLSCIAFI
jgi:hypothetical protein